MLSRMSSTLEVSLNEPAYDDASSASQAAESGIVVATVLPAEVENVRQRFTAEAALGAPAHVTLLYPWIPPCQLTLDDVHRLGDVVAAHRSFDGQFTSIEEFPGGVFYLKPEPHDELMELISLVHRLYPDYPPYEGRFPSVVPHATLVGSTTQIPDEEQWSVEDAESAVAGLESYLPIPFSVTEIQVLCGNHEEKPWTPLARCALAH